MRLECECDHMLCNVPRITSFDQFPREGIFDELLQFFNLINGAMSAIGPQPIVVAEITRYGRWFGDYYRGKPRLTRFLAGFAAQVKIATDRVAGDGDEDDTSA